MAAIEHTEDKLKKLGFNFLKTTTTDKDTKDKKENTILYRSLGNNIDFVISKDYDIVRFLSLEISEIESFHVVKNYITIIMKNGKEHEFKEIQYESLDQELLLLFVENKSSKKTHNSVNL
jgi:hypothetical protein